MSLRRADERSVIRRMGFVRRMGIHAAEGIHTPNGIHTAEGAIAFPPYMLNNGGRHEHFLNTRSCGFIFLHLHNL